jgi:hypothetical protein
VTDDQTPPPVHLPVEDAVVTALRGALAREADRVTPSPDGLGRIREAISSGGAGRRGNRGWIPLLAAAATVLVLAGVGGVALLGGLHRPPSAASPAGGSTPTPSTPATPSPSGTTAPSVAGPNLPVYWVGASRTRLWLYREFVPTSSVTPADRAEAALTAMLSGPPADPDYSTPWHGSPATVDVGDHEITVNLTAAAFANPDVDAERARLAVQQLVYTVTAATQLSVPVRILVNGRSGYEAWGLLRLGDPVSRDSSAVAPIWVTDPQQGQRVGSPVTVDGVGSAFEGTLAWEVTSADGQVVDSDTTQGGAQAPAPFRFTLRLPPGTYTLTVWSPDESSGESPEGPRMFPDSKTFTVD